MNEKLFRTLLFQSEGPDLDFKRDQYAFKGASDLDKSKLLKDILTFANSWRFADAYILIGVEELSNGARSPCGIPSGDHVDDASLQQFVSSKTNRHVDFRYEAFPLDGKSFGIITIPKQRRPLYAARDFGIVKAEEVYHGRGSSCALASPDDVYQMAVDDQTESQVEPAIRVELADSKRHRALGNSIPIKAINHHSHERKNFPDLVGPERSLFAPISDDTNPDFWRQLADYTLTHRATAPIAFMAQSVSVELARNVRLEIDHPKNSGLSLLEEDDLPEYPNYRRFAIPMFSPYPIRDPPKGTPKVLDHEDHWSVIVDFGDIQPQARAWSAPPIYVSACSSGQYSLELKVYADNLRGPHEAEIELKFDIDVRRCLSIGELSEIDERHLRELEVQLDE